MDIVEAFCQVPYPKGYRCFVRLHGLLEAEFGRYVELFKCLYGTKNAAREFYIRITEGLVRHGYEKCDIDQALLRRADPVTGKYLYLGLHVDDTLIVYSQDEQLQHLLSALQDIFGVDKVKLERQPSTFLGMSLDYHEIRDRNRLWATVDASYAACSDGRGITAITISLLCLVFTRPIWRHVLPLGCVLSMEGVQCRS
jgi:hypothetical protein